MKRQKPKLPWVPVPKPTRPHRDKRKVPKLRKDLWRNPEYLD